MPISFNEVPAGGLTPFFFVEIDNSGAFAGENTIPWKILLIGQQLATKTAPLEVTQITDLAQAIALFGAGSQLAAMVEAFLASNKSQPLHVLPLSDAAGSAAASGTIAFSGTATAAGSVKLMVGGRYLEVGVEATDTAAEIATAVAAAIQAASKLPVTASATGSTVTLTAKNKGAAGNEIDVRVNHYQGETLPTGVTATLVAMSGGSVDPDLSALGVSGLLSNRWFQAIAQPYTTTAALAYMETELTSRWKADTQRGGVLFVAKNAAFSTLTSFGAALNSPFLVALNARNVPTTPWEFAAEAAGIVAYQAAIDPARPLQTLAFSWAKAPTQSQENNWTENETLLQSGVATFTVAADRTVRVQRMVTTYKTSPTGAADPSYRDVETVYTLQAIRYDWATYMGNKYHRHKLADDGANFGAGQAVITPKVGRAEAINRFKVWEASGWVEGVEDFKANLVVERNASDVNRLDFLLPPNLMNQFRVGASQIRFIL